MKRKEGRLIKHMDPFVKIFPYVMDRRTDAMIFAKEVIITEPIDAFIEEKRKEGHQLSYLHLLSAAYVRTLAERPKLNRFIMNNKYYARDGITMSMTVKRRLVDDGNETTVKFRFKGTESIYEVEKIINDTIVEALKNEEDSPSVDRLVEWILKLPGIVKRGMVKFLVWLDRHSMLPDKIIEVSPFHASFFLTHLRSIRASYVYHHLYNIGTVGAFVAVGKTVRMPVVVDDQVVVKDCIEVGYTMDERLCDGLYMANSFKLAKKYIEHPALLEQPLEKIIEDEI